MKPMEAWCVISANLANLYKMRRAIDPKDKGFTEAETQAEVICFQALKETEERRTAYIRRTGYLKSALERSENGTEEL